VKGKIYDKYLIQNNMKQRVTLSPVFLDHSADVYGNWANLLV